MTKPTNDPVNTTLNEKRFVEVDRRAVSWERADEIRAGWTEITGKWIENEMDDERLNEWAALFAPEHPEWNHPLNPSKSEAA